jgi:pyridoxine 5'-phosphate synthase PdxJ
MNNQNEILAQKVVESFKRHVSAEAREHISEHDFTVLGLIVQEALSLEMAEAVEMVDELEKRLKKIQGYRELGL